MALFGFGRKQHAAPAVGSAGRAAGSDIDIDIVGEASYRPALRSLAKAVGGEEFQIVLRADPHNSYDRNAVAVYAHGAPVGFLPRRMAAAWQSAVLRAERQGFVVTGTAGLFGGTEDKPHFGVFGQATWPGDGEPLDRWHL